MRVSASGFLYNPKFVETIMKQKIIAALKTKYQRFGLSNEAVDRIASAKEKTVTSEDEIEGAIADAQTMELIANELQKSADAERRNRSNLQKSFDEYKEKHPDSGKGGDETHEEDLNGDEPAWAKKLRESNERIEARFKAEDDAKKNAANKTAVEAKLKAAGCVNAGILKSVMKGFALGENESVDDAATRLQTEYNDSYKETFGEGPKPGLGNGNYGGDAKKAADAMNDYLRQEGLLPKKE